MHEYDGEFRGQPARFKVTATVGHMYSLDFPKEANDWNKVKPVDLFDHRTQRMEDPGPRMTEHLRAEAKGALG